MTIYDLKEALSGLPEHWIIEADLDIEVELGVEDAGATILHIRRQCVADAARVGSGALVLSIQS